MKPIIAFVLVLISSTVLGTVLHAQNVYVGSFLGRNSASMICSTNLTDCPFIGFDEVFDTAHNEVGLFGGFRTASKPVFIGVEGEIARGELDLFVDNNPYASAHSRVKLLVGADISNATVYGFVGAGSLRLDHIAGGWIVTGPTRVFGAGVEYDINERIGIRVESLTEVGTLTDIRNTYDWKNTSVRAGVTVTFK